MHSFKDITQVCTCCVTQMQSTLWYPWLMIKSKGALSHVLSSTKTKVIKVKFNFSKINTGKFLKVVVSIRKIMHTDLAG